MKLVSAQRETPQGLARSPGKRLVVVENQRLRTHGSGLLALGKTRPRLRDFFFAITRRHRGYQVADQPHG